MVVKTSAAMFLNSAPLNGPGSGTSTFGVLETLSNGSRAMVANYTLILNRGGADFDISARIFFGGLDSDRVATCVSAGRPVSGTNKCNVRNGKALFYRGVRNSCFGIIKLPISGLGSTMGSFLGRWG